MAEYGIGICEWLMPVNGPAAFSIAKELGFDGVQILDLGGAENNFILNNPQVQDSYKKAAQDAGVEIHTLQLQALVRSGKIKSPPGSTGFQDAVVSIKKGISACKALGIKRLMVENFFDSWIYNSYELENTGALLKAAGELTQDAGIQLIYESFVGVDKTLQLYEMSGKAFRLCYDVLNPLKYGFGDPVEELKRYPLDMIDHIHCKDTAPDFSCSALLGQGTGRFDETLAVLREAGYTGWLITENYYCVGRFGADNDPYHTMKADADTLRNLHLSGCKLAQKQSTK